MRWGVGPNGPGLDSLPPHIIFCGNGHASGGGATIRARIKRYLKLGLGWAFVLLGVAGLFLPILQGILFLAIGFSILATELPWAERQLHRLRTRFPRAAHHVDDAKAKVAHWRRRLATKADPCE